MENKVKLLSGSEIIYQKLNGPKELTTSGWKEYCPTNSWLEQKQIQAYLEDKCLSVGAQRIEKQSNLAQAQWINDSKRAKVTKKVGKHWEVVGYHQDNEDWLFPEEALYLIEINVLELFHDGVPVSIEHAYALLLDDSHNCTLQEYRVYSYLCRKGYKLVRHSEDITVTSYEKKIHLDQVLINQKRKVPSVNVELNPLVPKQILETNIIPMDTTVTENVEMSSVNSKTDNGNSKAIKKSPTWSVSDSDDVCIIEDNIEVIDIGDNSLKQMSSENTLKIHEKNKKHIIAEDPECIVIIDEDEDDEIEGENACVKQESESDTSDTEDDDDDDDVIIVKSIRRKSRQWYRPLRKCLIPLELIIVDLCNENSLEIKTEADDESIQAVANKSRDDILDEMTNANSGGSFIKSPNILFLPKEIIPKHSQYRVNLNRRQERNNDLSIPVYPSNRRHQQYYNSPNSNMISDQVSNAFLGNNVFMQAYEMRAMAISMIKAASSLISAVNYQSPVSNSSLINDMQVPQLYNPNQFTNVGYTPRHFNNTSFNNNSFNSNTYNSSRNSFMGRNSGYTFPRRNFRFRHYRHNYNGRAQSPHLRQVPRNSNRNITFPSVTDVVEVEADNESGSEHTIKRKGVNLGLASKKSKPCKVIEVIDLCDDKLVKSEPDQNERQDQGKITPKIELIENVSNACDLDRKLNFVAEFKQECKEISTEFKCEEQDVQQNSFHVVQKLSEPKVEIHNENSSEQPHDSNEQVYDVLLAEKQSNQIETEERPTTVSPTLRVVRGNESQEIAQEPNNSEMDISESDAPIPESQSVLADEEIVAAEIPTSWQQYKEQTEQIETPEFEDVASLTKPDEIKDIATLLKGLQIFGPIEENSSKEVIGWKISFDAYLPTDHFKKTVKMLPKFRIIVVNSTDFLPSTLEIDVLKSHYQDEIPFVYAIVYDDTIAFYNYDTVKLTEYFD